jgi:hypothetical protein
MKLFFERLKLSGKIIGISVLCYVGFTIFMFLIWGWKENVCTLIDLFILKDLWGEEKCGGFYLYGGRFLLIFLAILGMVLLFCDMKDEQENDRS